MLPAPGLTGGLISILNKQAACSTVLTEWRQVEPAAG